MKKIKIILVALMMVIGFNACQEDEMVKINPKAETGELTFKLNPSRYSNYTYVLAEENNDLSMEALTAVQPDYNFTAAVTYYVQASFSEDMNDAQELATSVNGEKVPVNVKDMNKAILKLYNGQMPNPTVAKDVFVRLKAVVTDAMQTPLDSVPTVKPLYSNVVKLNILPYFMEDLVSYKEAKKLAFWYVIGLGDGKWTNEPAGIGASLFPLSVIEGKHYDSEGNGIFKYTGYIKATQGFKVIRTPGSWNTQWGNSGSVGIDNPVMNDGGSKDFKVPEDGYYTITLNSIMNELKITKVDITPSAYNAIGLIGAMTDWASDIEMSAFQEENNHQWWAEYTFKDDSQCKFRANGSWTTNWGTSSDQDGDALYSKTGLGVAGGKNLIQTKGTYVVIFNDLDGFYYFYKK